MARSPNFLKSRGSRTSSKPMTQTTSQSRIPYFLADVLFQPLKLQIFHIN
ncbi:hypothetical protein FJSC11DRAFT_0992 [Fischerella thermalis JSC-11]|jgi:hypothetical protein|uniref:Uncharacterized protein n=1 Tax=Fischerella thermalis JSC-11 TaxID=741277 RepID=G6FQ45_9CYAN|nr:hypothetical protein FJSC11DRAFT_0992 [Fischerella thermalis JSC-11]